MICRLLPLSDVAVQADCVNETSTAQLAAAVRAARPAWLIDVVPAYTSLAVLFDPAQTDVLAVQTWLHTQSARPTATVVGSTWEIPCCYEQGPDLDWVAQYTGLTPTEVVRWHTAQAFSVYAIGFCPGFAYLGYLPPALAGVPRLATPRTRVAPGSIGLTGRQTGVYPLPRPGGWPLIGHTPITLVDLATAYFPLRVGDRVRFRAVTAAEWAQISPRLQPLLAESARGE
jgi:inhibitor of KinA